MTNEIDPGGFGFGFGGFGGGGRCKQSLRTIRARHTQGSEPYRGRWEFQLAGSEFNP